MKSTDFMDEWNRTHPSSPSYQDVLDWAEKKYLIEIEELNKEQEITLILQKKYILNKVCSLLIKNLPDIEYITNVSPFKQNKAEFIKTFMEGIEK